jgi:hypothetical protein
MKCVEFVEGTNVVLVDDITNQPRMLFHEPTSMSK